MENKDEIILANNIINKTNEYMENNKLSPIVEIQLSQFKSHIEKLKRKLQLDKFNLVFMGKSHVGKTVCISSILDMYYKDNGKMYQVMPSTAKGNTTACLVEINILDKDNYNNEFIIKSISEEELKSVLKEYCKTLVIDQAESEKGDICQEYKRIIDRKIGNNENLLNLNNDLNKLSESFYDYIKCNEGIKNEYSEVIASDDKNETLKRLSELISNANNGLIQGIIIPYKIVLNINKSFLNVPDFVNKIIDTRGLDNSESIETRKDLKNYFNRDDTFIVYVNEFTNMDKDVIEFYTSKLKYIGIELSDFLQFILLINCKNEVMEEAVDEEKEIEDKINEFMNQIKPLTSADLNENTDTIEEIKEQYKKISEQAKKLDVQIGNFFVFEALKGLEKKTKNKRTYYAIDEDICGEELRKQNVENTYKYFENIFISVRKNILNTLKYYEGMIESCIKNSLGVNFADYLNRKIVDYTEIIKLNVYNDIKEFYLNGYLSDWSDCVNFISPNTIAAHMRNKGGVYRKGEWYTIRDDVESKTCFDRKRQDVLKTVIQNNCIKEFNKVIEEIKQHESMDSTKLEILIEALKSFYINFEINKIETYSERIKCALDDIFYEDRYNLNFWDKVKEKREEGNKYKDAFAGAIEDMKVIARITSTNQIMSFNE